MSRLSDTLERMKVAYIEGKRIFVLLTDELSFVNKILEKQSLIQNRIVTDANGKEYSTYQFCTASDKEYGIKFGFTFPCVFVFRVSRDNANQLNVPFNDLYEFTNICSGLTEKKHDNSESLKKSIIILCSDEPLELTPSVNVFAETIKVRLMDEGEFTSYVKALMLNLDRDEVEELETRLESDTDFFKRLFHSMRGLNPTQITATIEEYKVRYDRVYYSSKDDGFNKLLKFVRGKTNTVISESGALSLIDSDNAPEPSGMDNLSEWLEKRKEIVRNIQNYKDDYVMKPLNGILVSGVPGCGKSMMAKYVARMFDLPLVRFDLGDIRGGFVGDTEKNMNKALETIESLCPCVLFVDEIDKGLAGSKDGHETTIRAFGKFLTWMQEKSDKDYTSFLVATANKISSEAIPPEMLRSGRLSAKFGLFMPTAEECSKIFESHIKRQNDSFKRTHRGNKSLFDLNKINKQFFMKVLNGGQFQCGYEQTIKFECINETENKFLIGADIEELISNAKLSYMNDWLQENENGNRYIPLNEIRENFIFDSYKFALKIKESITEIRTYGETNLGDIVECYRQLAHNDFTSASKEKFMPFENYNKLEDTYMADADDTTFYDSYMSRKIIGLINKNNT